jgi:hypothetical protein
MLKFCLKTLSDFGWRSNCMSIFQRLMLTVEPLQTMGGIAPSLANTRNAR